jgi:hypothetical protein
MLIHAHTQTIHHMTSITLQQYSSEFFGSWVMGLQAIQVLSSQEIFKNMITCITVLHHSDHHKSSNVYMDMQSMQTARTGTMKASHCSV